MKKIYSLFLALLLVGLFIAPSFAQPTVGSSVVIDHTSGQDSSGATVTPLTAVSGKTIYVFGIAYKVDTADSVALSCGTGAGAKHTYTLAADQGFALMYFPMYIDCDTNTALTLTKGSASTLLEYELFYTQETD